MIYMNIDEIRRTNLKELEKVYGSSLVKIIGMSSTQFYNLRDGAKDSKTGKPRGMRQETAWRIEDAVGMPRGWLSIDHSQEPKSPKIKSNDIEISLLSAVGSMGNGNEIHDSEVVVDVLKLKKNWVEKNIHLSSFNNLSFIHAIGNSMSPTLNDGDILLVDSGIKEITGDCIYVLEAHKRLFIKSVRQTINGQYEIYSDNPAVKTVDVLNGDHEVNVLGRVVWVWNGKKV